MLVRQRLRAIVESRKAQYVCWACSSQAQSSPFATGNIDPNSLALKQRRSASSRQVHISNEYVEDETTSLEKRKKKTGTQRQPSFIEWKDYGGYHATRSSQAAFGGDFVAPIRKRQKRQYANARACQSVSLARQYSTNSRSGETNRKALYSFAVSTHRALSPQNMMLVQSPVKQIWKEEKYLDRSIQSKLKSTRRGSIETRALFGTKNQSYCSESYKKAEDLPIQEKWPMPRQSQEQPPTFDQCRELLEPGRNETRHTRSLSPSASIRLSNGSSPKKMLYKSRQSVRHLQARSYSNASEAQHLKTTKDEAQIAGTFKPRLEPIRTHLESWRDSHESQMRRSGNSARLVSRQPNSSAPAGIEYQNILESAEDDFEDRDLGQNLGFDDVVTRDQHIEDSNQSNLPLAEGDLIDFVQYAGKDPQMGVVIRRFGLDLLVLNDRGQWKHTKCSKVNFVVPQFLNPKLSRRLQVFGPSIGEMLSPGGQDLAALTRSRLPAPRNVTREIMTQMAGFRKAADVVFQKNAAILNRAQELIADKGDSPNAPKDLRVVARRLLGKPPDASVGDVGLFVVNRAVGESEHISFRRTYHSLKMELHVASSSTIETVKTVREWVREYQEALVSNNQGSHSIKSIDASAMDNPIGTFVTKARRAILRNREIRPLSPIGTVGPALTDSEQPPSACEIFNKDEMKIVDFLRDWVWTDPSTAGKTPTFSGAGSMIIRAIGLYEEQSFDRFRAWTVLKELNVVHPWEPAPSQYGSIEVPDLDSTNAMALSRDRAWETVADTHFEDSMSHLRKDWGDLAVFCIDSEETLERDDGISLESIPQEPDNVWLHVHVANPTAFISPGSLIANYFRAHGENCYFPHQRSPLLPPDLAQNHFSLGSNRPCITFSAKLSSRGDLLEHNITNGIVRNVYFVTPNKVERILDENARLKRQESAPVLQIGGIPEKVQPRDPVRRLESLRLLGEEEFAILRRLSSVTKARSMKRSGNLSFDTDKVAAQARFLASVNFPPHNVVHGAQEASQRNRDPTIVIRSGDWHRNTMTSLAIMESMLLAGQVCASWCKERIIPIPYRGHVENSQPVMSPDLFRSAFLEPFAQKLSTGAQAEPDPAALLQLGRLQKTYAALLGSLSLGADPLKHLTLGVPAYCKATSPLRRYVDMLAHWQVEAALRYEHATKTSLAGRDPAFLAHAPKLPFSKQQIALASRDLHLRENDTQHAHRRMRHFWILQAMHHAFYFDSASPLPRTFEARVLRSYSGGGAYARVLGWDVDARIDDAPASLNAGGLRANDRWEVQLRQVDTDADRVECVPLRLLWRDHGVASSREAPTAPWPPVVASGAG